MSADEMDAACMELLREVVFAGFLAVDEVRELGNAEVVRVAAKVLAAYRAELDLDYGYTHHATTETVMDVGAIFQHNDWAYVSELEIPGTKGPRIDWWKNYQLYLHSPEWQAKAAAAKRHARYRCQFCNEERSEAHLDAHHRTYERLGREWTSDVTVFCGACHRLLHADVKVRGKYIGVLHDIAKVMAKHKGDFWLVRRGEKAKVAASWKIGSKGLCSPDWASIASANGYEIAHVRMRGERMLAGG